MCHFPFFCVKTSNFKKKPVTVYGGKKITIWSNVQCLRGLLLSTENEWGPRWHGAVLQIGRSLVRFQMVSLEYIIDIKSFRSHYGPGVGSASNRNEYQEHFLGVKAAGA